MKKTVILFLALVLSIATLPSQVIKRQFVNTPGTLANLASEYLSTVNNLFITGNIDARDFKTMRDSMPLLVSVDLSGVTIVAYSGTDGTIAGTSSEVYPANEIPAYSFYNSSTYNGKTSLIAVVLPLSAKSIGNYSFSLCDHLTSIIISNSVSRIGGSAFRNCSSLRSLTIPDSVTSIGESAFNYCSSLSSLNLPFSVVTIENSAFSSCVNLTDITFSNSITSIGNNAFFSCNKLKNITLPTSLISIGSDAFSNCTGLTNITIPTKVIFIGSGAFSNCTGLANIDIPKTIVSIGSDAFSNCIGLTNIAIPDSLKTIESSTFSNCTSLTNISIPNSVRSIGRFAFRNCKGLINLTIPPSVITIGAYAFSDCSGLISINMNCKPLTITEYDFQGVNTGSCILNVPYKTKSLYGSASNWKNFTKIIEADTGFLVDANYVNLNGITDCSTVSIAANVAWIASSDQSWLAVSPEADGGNNTLKLTAQANQTATSRTAIVTISSQGFASQTITVKQDEPPTGITISAGGLSTALTRTELSTIQNIKVFGTIDARDFKTIRDSMPQLTRIDLSQAIIAGYTGSEGTYGAIRMAYPANKVPECAFYKSGASGNKNITNIILPESSETIGRYAFYSVSSLINMIIPDSVTSISDCAFSGCKSLNNLTISNSVNSIGGNAFSGCKSLTSITLPGSLSNIGTCIFYGCDKLTSIKVEIENQNYSGKDGVLFNKDQTIMICYPIGKEEKSYSIPDTVDSIAGYAFSYCENLNSITIPVTVKSIASNAFESCIGLTNINIPSSISSINNYAFYNCNGLKSIYVNTAIPVDLSNNYSVFNNVNKTTCTLYVPVGSKVLYQAAVQWKDFTNIVELATAIPKVPFVDNVRVFPNPVVDKLTITGIDENTQISILDLNGRRLLEHKLTTDNTISLGKLPRGQYVLRIGNYTKNKHIIIIKL